MPYVNPSGSDMPLIQEAMAGDKHAFGRLYDLYAGQIFRYVLLRVGDRSAAMDMTEDVFLKAWESLPRFGRKERGLNFRAWLYRIAHNSIIDRYRTDRGEIPIDTLPQWADDQPSVTRLIEQSEQAGELIRALQELDPVAEQVIILKFHAGLDAGEIARVMDLSAGNVRIIQYRGLKKLREILGEDDERK